MFIRSFFVACSYIIRIYTNEVRTNYEEGMRNWSVKKSR
jgi:hypothetical protein